MPAEAVRQIKVLRQALQEILEHYPSEYSLARRVALQALEAVPAPAGPTEEEIREAIAGLQQIDREQGDGD